MNLESLYGRLPATFLQNWACSVVGLSTKFTRYNHEFWHLLEEYERRTHWSQEKIRSYRDLCLRSFVKHCADNVAYYRSKFKEWGIDPQSIRGLEDLQRIPTLGKEQVQDHWFDLGSSAKLPSKSRIIHTSGTTGGGLQLVTTNQAIRHQWAVWWRYFRWHGLQHGTWCAHFGGRSIVPWTQAKPPFWRYNRPGRQILFSGYHMGPRTLPFYVDEMRKKRPLWLHGYPSHLALLAAHIVENNVDLGYQIRWITTGAESLLEHQADLMEKAFGLRPRQHYGMAEAVANISECPHGSLHVDEDFSAVEFVPHPHGLSHKIIGTNFTNPAMPLLRYDVEDMVTLAEDSCPCGLPGRVVLRIDGRREDYVILRSGTRIGRMDHIFKNMTSIREAQIIQREIGRIIVHVVKAGNYTHQDEVALRKEAVKRVGADTEVKIEYVDAITRTKTGKLRFVVSEIPEGRLTEVSP